MLRPEPLFQLQCLGAELGDYGAQPRDLGFESFLRLARFASTLSVAQPFEGRLACVVFPLIELPDGDLMSAAHVAHRLTGFASFVEDLQLLFGCPLPPCV